MIKRSSIGKFAGYETCPGPLGARNIVEDVKNPALAARKALLHIYYKLLFINI
jgi:hypothetical protein